MATKLTLKDVLSRPADRAPIVTVTGDAGVGKTTFAALFPKPVFIRFEDGVESIPEDRRPYSFPLARSCDDALDQLDMLLQEDNPFQTVVIDSVTKAASIIEAEIIASDPRKPKSINQALGGYGAGLSAAGERHRLLFNAAQALNEEKSMAVVFIAHSTVETVEPPDADPFTRYSLRLDKRAMQYYIDAADAVCFIRLNTKYITREDDDRRRAVSDKNRVLVLHTTAAHVSKNRYGIEDPIPWPSEQRWQNPLLARIPYFAKNLPKQGAKAPAQQAASPVAKSTASRGGRR